MSITATLLACVLAVPLVASLYIALTGAGKGYRYNGGLACLAVFISFVCSVWLLGIVIAAPAGSSSTTVQLWQWLSAGSVLPSVGVTLTIDPLSALMIMVITGVGFLIHLYAVGYMAEDEGVARFFSYMNFFIFSMLLLVLAANFIVLIVGWALVALSSYLLIGFWYDKPAAVLAARKAFITQVIGDVALVLAAFMFVLGTTSGSNGSGSHLYGAALSLPTLFAHASSFAIGSPYLVVACLLVAVGAFAKSAQFPLHTWLPDAMEGPTPVSALIHAATMVTAGVYLIARFHPLFERAPVATGVVACVGMGTALMAGLIALSQTDIKRVIAYSTMSQIGLMIYATGIGAYSAAMFHFAMHALFKALLFMAAGNVIHALAGEQDIRSMGGLGKRLRLTEICFVSGSLALAGIPIFAGWWSKEGLLGLGLINGPGAVPWLLYLVGIGVNVLTGLYSIRLWSTVFRGEPATDKAAAPHAAPLGASAKAWCASATRLLAPLFTWPILLLDKMAGRTAPKVENPIVEVPMTMMIPVVTLATLAAVIGIFLNWPFSLGSVTVSDFTQFLSPVFGNGGAQPLGAGVAWIGLLIGTACSVGGIYVGYRLWPGGTQDETVASRIPQGLVQLSSNKFYWDEIYDAVLVRPTLSVSRFVRRVAEPLGVDGLVNKVGEYMNDYSLVVRAWQTGFLRDYATIFTVFVAICLVLATFVAGRVA